MGSNTKMHRNGVPSQKGDSMCWHNEDSAHGQSSGTSQNSKLASERFRLVPTTEVNPQPHPLTWTWEVDTAVMGDSTTMQCKHAGICREPIEMYKMPLQLHQASPFGITTVERDATNQVRDVHLLQEELQLTSTNQSTHWVSSIPLRAELRQCSLEGVRSLVACADCVQDAPQCNCSDAGFTEWVVYPIWPLFATKIVMTLFAILASCQVNRIHIQVIGMFQNQTF